MWKGFFKLHFFFLSLQNYRTYYIYCLAGMQVVWQWFCYLYLFLQMWRVFCLLLQNLNSSLVLTIRMPVILWHTITIIWLKDKNRNDMMIDIAWISDLLSVTVALRFTHDLLMLKTLKHCSVTYFPYQLREACVIADGALVNLLSIL